MFTDNSLMPFGKHKGTKLINVPADYLLWLYDNIDLKEDLKKYVDDNYEKLMDEVRYKKK